MSEKDIERMLENMTKHQRQAMHDYAVCKRAGKPVPAHIVRTAIDAINVVTVTALWQRPLRAPEREVVLNAISAYLNRQKAETI